MLTEAAFCYSGIDSRNRKTKKNPKKRLNFKESETRTKKMQARWNQRQKNPPDQSIQEEYDEIQSRYEAQKQKRADLLKRYSESSILYTQDLEKYKIKQYTSPKTPKQVNSRSLLLNYLKSQYI